MMMMMMMMMMMKRFHHVFRRLEMESSILGLVTVLSLFALLLSGIFVGDIF